MSNSEIVEQLAAVIAEEVYIDIAKWHLYLNDAHLHIPLAESLFAFISEQKTINSAQLTEALNNIKVKIGGGKQEIPLGNFIPTTVQVRLLEILENNFKQSRKK